MQLLSHPAAAGGLNGRWGEPSTRHLDSDLTTPPDATVHLHAAAAKAKQGAVVHGEWGIHQEAAATASSMA